MSGVVLPFLKAPIDMISDIRALGGGISRWGAALNIPQIIGGLLFIGTIEGATVLLTEIACLLVAGQIHIRQRFSRLISICHLPWLILLPWLIWRLATQDYSLTMAVWLVYVVATIAISLLLDIRELILYARGDRTFAWAKGT